MPTAIITGASRGLGRALAVTLAQRGWDLVLDARGAPALKRTADEIRAQVHVEASAGDVSDNRPHIVAISGDVSDEQHHRDLLAAVDERLDLLVNNASVLGPSPQPELAEYPVAELERVYRVNVLAPLALIQLALPLMSDGGAILNITSDAAVEPYPGWGGYGSSKAALEQLTAILAAERPNLRVYAVDPGDMRTALHQEAFPGEDISDRPRPEESVPGLIQLISGSRPSGRYRTRQLVAGEAGG